MKKNKLLLIGWDAADWKIIYPLLAKGEMPALKSLIDRGVYGNMSTMNPPFSPMLWTTVATGKTPDKHGILGFIEPTADHQHIRPVTIENRKVRALWNILHHKGFKSNVVGWWPSYPVEPINGAIVSDKFQKIKKKGGRIKIESDFFHPPQLKNELENLKMYPEFVSSEHILPFIPKAAQIDQDKDKSIASFSKILSENTTVHNAVTRLLRTTDWDFTAVYYDLIDHICHGFMKFHPPKLPHIPQDKFELYKDVITGAYKFQDMMLERKLQLIDENTTVIVMSDHGYKSDHTRLAKLPKIQAAPAMDHREFGIFVAAGPNIKRNQKVFGLSLVDIAPSILNHFGLPIGKDMDGSVASDIYNTQPEIEYLDSWDKLNGDFGELKSNNSMNNILSDDEALEQLVDLGYIERPDENRSEAILKVQRDLKHNLAKVYIGKKDFSNAQKLLLELAKSKTKFDKGHVYKDLVSVGLGIKDISLASNYFEKLKTCKTETNYNLYFLESSILLAKKQPYKALSILKQELNGQHPSSELWYRIGQIYAQTNQLEAAKTHLEKAIDINPDKAKYHVSLAETLLALKQYDEASEYALTAIELVKYYAKAHYILGRALEKMGDVANSKLALEFAAQLKPQNYLIKHSLDNIEEKLRQPDLINTSISGSSHHHNIIVSGLPRSGTSLMMQILNSNNIELIYDKQRQADSSNPKGYFEYKPVMSIHKDNSWLEECAHKAVKIVAPLLKFIDPKLKYKVIFMKRDLNEIVLSQDVMLNKKSTFNTSLYNKYIKLLSSIDRWKNKQPGVHFIYIDFNILLTNPDEELKKLELFLGQKINFNKTKSIIDKKLYRNKFN